jgi:hypothetical protein
MDNKKKFTELVRLKEVENQRKMPSSFSLARRSQLHLYVSLISLTFVFCKFFIEAIKFKEKLYKHDPAINADDGITEEEVAIDYAYQRGVLEGEELFHRAFPIAAAGASVAVIGLLGMFAYTIKSIIDKKSYSNPNYG